MRKIIGMGVLVLSVVMGIYLTCFLEHSVRYEQCTADNAQLADIIAVREKTEGLLETLVFDEEALFYDSNSKTFYYSLLEGNSDAYNPKVTPQGKNVNLKLAFSVEHITADMIARNQEIYFLAYTDDMYCDYYLKCTTLPLMNIESDEIAHPEEILDDPVVMRMEIFDNRKGAASRLVSSDGMIHIRGGSTRGYPKRGYRLSLTQESVGNHVRNNDISLLGMRQDDDWILYAAYNDPEKIRNVFSTNLWKYTCATDNAGRIDTGTEYQYLELFMNGEYWGLYALGYPVDRKQLQVGIENDREALYKVVTWVDRNRVSATGGNGYEAKGIEDDDEDWAAMLFAFYDDMLRYADDNERLYNAIDIDNAIDVSLFLNLIQGADNVSVNLVKNLFVAIRREEDDRLTGLYAPWDMDISWGNLWEQDALLFTVPYGMVAADNYVMESGHLNWLISNGDEAVWEKLFEKYQRLRAGAWSEENLNKLLDKYEADIYGSGAFLRDMARWPEGFFADASDGLNTFRAYVMERLREMDAYYDRLSKVCGESVFVRRSAQYNAFQESVFIIEVNNRKLLEDSDYTDLFAYMGIDMSAVTEDVHFIIAQPSEGKYEYLPSLSNDGVNSGIGADCFSVNQIRDGVYEAALDGVVCYDFTVFSKPEIRMVLINNKTVRDFSFEKGYEAQSARDRLTELSTYVEGMTVTGYHAIIEINNPAVWDNPDYAEVFAKLGLGEESIRETTDIIVWNGQDKTVCALDNFHVSGSRSETPAGMLSLFENDERTFGLYLDNAELLLESAEQREEKDIEIWLLNPDSHEIVESTYF